MPYFTNPEQCVLMPGEYYFGGDYARISTLLGSCVAITFWHPSKKIGGMCHYLLPTRGDKQGSKKSGRYADEAMLIFVREMHIHQTSPGDYVVRMFGASNMISTREDGCVADHHCLNCTSIACKNRFAAYEETRKRGFVVAGSDLGGAQARLLELTLATGATAITRVPRLQGAISQNGFGL